MDIQEVLNNTKEKFSQISEKIKDFVTENKFTSLCIGLLFLVILVALILLGVAGSKPKTKVYQRPLTITEDILIPPSPAVPDGYNTWRNTKDSWTNEEIEEWFTIPGQKELEDLSKANDRIINEITGAAP